MASLIHCPHCGKRPREEFTVRGAALSRPAPDAPDDVWFEHIYLRDNPMGPHTEFWHHLAGCRRWLVVTRDTLTHQTLAVADASDWTTGAGA